MLFAFFVLLLFLQSIASRRLERTVVKSRTIVGVFAVLRQLILGGAVNLGNITIHALVTVLLVRARPVIEAKLRSSPTLQLMFVMIAVVSTLMAAHLFEMTIWALIYALVGIAPEGSDYFYFAFVNYTTLGYGDVVPVERWHLLGPMTAMNGVLLFGWSTAIIVQALWINLRSSREN